MDGKETEQTPKVTSKSFLAVGPTLHYSHANVQRCWLLAIAVFAVSCLFWSRIVSGTFWSFDVEAITSAQYWRLGKPFVTGLSIFEYPWQILVLGLLMGVFAIVPVLTSQLLSFRYSLVFILVTLFLANLPGFAVSLLVSCFAAACRPLRFRSRIIAIALCTAPQLVYWGCFGAARDVEPIEWGFSFAPWVCAWFVGLSIAGFVLGIGHYTRYKPGLIWVFTLLTLIAAMLVFEFEVGLDELDYQLYVVKNDPEQTPEFREHNITPALDQTMTNPAVRKYLASYLYPTEPIPLRQELKKEMQIGLGNDRWPSWFIVPDELKYQKKKRSLNEQYDLFIQPDKPVWMPKFVHDEWTRRRLTSKRMPIALYYKALLSEYSPDVKLLGEKEVLRFYSDYPFERSGEAWFRLYRDFPDSPESLEARWRMAEHLAGRGFFAQADAILIKAQDGLAKAVERLEQGSQPTDSLFSVFRPPADSVMTVVKLRELGRRINELRTLIGPENRADDVESAKRLAAFVMLNPHSLDYDRQLAILLAAVGEKDGLRDNILLAQAGLVADEQLRAERLRQLHMEFENTDGGMQALYELTLLRIRQYQAESNIEQKKTLLADARATLTSFVGLYPYSFYAEQAKKNLDDLPKVE